jgi:hypothetical protein
MFCTVYSRVLPQLRNLRENKHGEEMGDKLMPSFPWLLTSSEAHGQHSFQISPFVVVALRSFGDLSSQSRLRKRLYLWSVVPVRLLCNSMSRCFPPWVVRLCFTECVVPVHWVGYY